MSIYKCHHGCGQDAIHQTKSGKWICNTSATKCPAVREKNSKRLKEAYSSGKRKDPKLLYQNLPEETKEKMAWNKGLTKDDHPSIQRYANTLSEIQKGKPGHKHTEKTKNILSKKRIHFLENNNKHCNWYEVAGVKVQGKLEKAFAEFLVLNDIEFQRKPIKYQGHRRYTPDFYIPSLDIYIEVKGFLFEKDKAKLNAVLSEHNIDLRIAYKEDIEKLIDQNNILSLPKVIDSIDFSNIDYSKFENHWGAEGNWHT